VYRTATVTGVEQHLLTTAETAPVEIPETALVCRIAMAIGAERLLSTTVENVLAATPEILLALQIAPVYPEEQQL